MMPPSPHIPEASYPIARAFCAAASAAHAFIREQVGSTIQRLHRYGAIADNGAGRASKWKSESR